jgi:hypothetical protein
MAKSPSDAQHRPGIVPARTEPGRPVAPAVRHGVVPARIQKKRVPLGGGPLAGSGPGNFPDFLYRGGVVINTPQVHAVFLGDWTSTANQTRATRLQQFITDLLGSSYMNMLSQYGCGTSGALVSSVFISDTTASLNDSDLHTVLQTAINNSQVPEPVANSNIVFLVYLDDNMVVVDEQICEAAGNFGYHSHFQTTAGNECFYGIIPGLSDACLTTTCSGDDIDCSLHLAQTQEQRQTQVISHEFSEMITNPNVALSLTDTRVESWCRPLTAVPVGPHEAGDICNGQTGTITVGSNSWNVQLMYSKWDDMNSNGATTCVSAEASPLPSMLPVVSLVLDRSTFGRDEVNSFGGVATFQDALYVFLDGFIPAELGLTSANLTSPPTFLSFAGAFPGLPGVLIALDTSLGVQLEDATNFQTIQRITVPLNIQFTDLNAFNGITSPPGFQDFTISATVTVTASGPFPSLTRSSGTAEIELVLQADPFMSAGENWWLSNDMRAFAVTPAALPPGNVPLQFSTTAYTSDPNTYIQALIAELNTNFTDPSTTNTPFNSISANEDQSALQLSQNDTSGNPVFNFALARVHLRGDTANAVRAFFRLFIASSPDTVFSPGTTYRSLPQTDAAGNNIAGTLIPVIGFPSSDMTATIPFFAEPRVVSTSESTTRQLDPTNVQTIPSPLAPTPPPGTEVFAYFGCYLDLNQPTPMFPLNPATASTPNGPWTAAEIVSIPTIIMGNHACLVTEIAYDPDPIPSGASPATSDKLGQRNLSWVGSDNPGALASHRVPTLFDLHPSATLRPTQEQPPDELMIEWGNTPSGSLASMYLPQVSADEILALTERLYTTRLLTKQDANTIQCRTGSVTYVPIPAGSGKSFSGLLTVDLPSTVRTGQQFQIVVRRITSRITRELPNAVAKLPNGRYVAGAFQINIPVGTARLLLAPEESLLAVFKWKLDQLPTTNRWHPVLQRYIEQVSGRVEGFGGNPQTIPPSPKGYPVPGGKPNGGPEVETIERVGKVSGLRYDRFGDFDGFMLETERGHEEVFRSAEDAIEDLVRRAWLERYVVAVFAARQEPHRLTSIVLRRAPRDRD